MITFDAVFAACVHQHCGTDNVGVQENLRVFDGTVNMAFCCEVYNILKKNQYGQYLKDVLDGKYMDVLH